MTRLSPFGGEQSIILGKLYVTNCRSRTSNLAFRFVTTAFCTLASLFGCSDVPDNYDQLSPIERAVHHPQRPRADKQRDDRRQPLEVLKLFEVRPGMTIVDIMGGGGFYTELFSYLVGDNGKVYLQNNSLFLRFSTDDLVARLQENRLPNVTRLDSEFADLKLPASDVLFLGLSYHDIYVPREDPVIQADPEQFKAQLLSALNPEGVLVIVDHAARPNSGIQDTPSLHRIDRDFVVADLEGAGFKLVSESEHLRKLNDQYEKSIWERGVMGRTDRFVLVFKRADSEEASP